jgi:hypothetical protein
VALRDPEVGALQVASVERCSVRGGASDPPAPCVLISRAERGTGQQSLTVTMAFASRAR